MLPQTATLDALKRAGRLFFLDVEHELKERLVHLALSSAVLSSQRCRESSKDDGLVDCSGVTCMLQWAVANSSTVSPQLLNEVQTVAQSLKGYAQEELCSICKAKIPFLSSETGECQGNQQHKLSRCSVTFEICPLHSLWFCNCCARWASKQTPRTFLTLSSRHALEQLQESLVLYKDVEPTCPYCGILMQRFLPDCLLRLSLI